MGLMMIFRFNWGVFIMGEINLASSLVTVNRLNSKIQRISADGSRAKEVHDIATQILLECEIIREATNHALQGDKPGFFKRWFGNGKN
jgi:hypothetical protein